MAVDDRFQVAGEAAIEQRRRTARFGGCDDFREQTTGASGNGGPHNSHGAGFELDDDLRTQADVRHQSGEVAGGFSFRDVDGCHIHDDTPIQAFFLRWNETAGLAKQIMLFAAYSKCREETSQ